jgi:NAD+ kinase
MLAALYNRSFDQANVPTLQHVVQLLEQYRIGIVVYKDFLERLRPHVSFVNPPQVFTGHADLPRQTDVLMSLGGDGTMLDAISFVGASNIPLLGINLGRLGFLAVVPADNVENAILSMVRSAYTLDKRSLIHLDASVPLFGDAPFGLNEFTLHRKDSSSMIKIHTYINGEFLNTYWADGLVVSTPTGSTGYSLSCGGPVVFPQASSFVITPVAPHNLNTRPIIVSDDSVVSFQVEGRAEQFLATLDSRMESITSTVQLAVRRESFTISLIRPDDQNFLRTIRQKLYWGIDRRN